VAIRQLKVVVVEGPDRGRHCEASDDGPITVGASPENDLALTDSTVSRYHVELRSDPRGIAIVDLGSLNGALVGEVRVERAVVRAGTSLRLGDTVLRVEDGARVSPASEPESELLPGVIGTSPAMRTLARKCRKLATSEASVLIEGETGTGKELVARAIHQASRRRDRPFVVVDCGSLPPALIASELFGHERGAFTGASALHQGAFERAGGGTIFLDEIGELPLSIQPALLGVLQRHSFRRVGGTSELTVDLRVLAATNRDLRAEVNAGTFRADLYFRLAVGRVELPPLRARRSDIAPLVTHFVEEITGTTELPFSLETMASLEAQHWSGNVRELRNVVEAALAMGELVLSSPEAGEPACAPAPTGEPLPYREARAAAIAGFESRYLSELIRSAGGNASRASRLARMDRPYLLALLRKHGLR